MTYCVAMRLDAGLVFLSDSRTNAGVDAVSTFRKMTVFERPGDRLMVMMTAGNLAISQAVRQALQVPDADGNTLWTVSSLFEAARMVGAAIRRVHALDAESLKQFGIDFSVSVIFGGQIKGERMRLFNIYAAGNFIEATSENCFFQIGEAKYGKPILDRVISASTPLAEAAKCALVSMDSTLKSNISVGLPLDLLVYRADELTVGDFVTVDEQNPYFQLIRSTWGQRLKQVFSEIPDPVWNDGGNAQFSLQPTGQASRDSGPVVIHPPAASQD